MATIKTQLIEEFRELVKQDDYDALEYWYPKFNPLIKGIKKARKMTLVALASGKMSGRVRNRINCLLYGEHGTGKTEIRDWIVDELGGVGASPQSSEAGLIFDARGEGTDGCLSIAHNSSGIVAIEELSEFERGERESLREAMGKGYYEINKGDHRKRIPTKVVVIACANEIDKFSDGLLERFDLKIEMEKPVKEEEKEITDHLYDVWEKEEDDYFDDVRDMPDWMKLKDYLEWSKKYKPKMDKETKEKIKEMKNLFIDIYHERGEGSDIRQKQTFYRTAKVIARLNHRPVKTDDFITAIELHNGEMPEGIMDALERVKEN